MLSVTKVKPAKHVAEQESDPSVLKVLFGHGLHSVACGKGENEFTGHAVQTVLFGPRRIRSFDRMEGGGGRANVPDCSTYPAGQVIHESAPVPLNVSGGHEVQNEAFSRE